VADSTTELLGAALAGQRAAVRALADHLTPVVQARVARVLLRRERGATGRDARQDVESVDAEKVCFTTRGEKTATMSQVEFIRRFLLHILPKGFIKIRHFGLTASSNAKTKLERARQLLTSKGPKAAPPVHAHDATLSPPLDWRELLRLVTGVDLGRCAACGERNLTRLPMMIGRPGDIARAPPTATP
jgi:hypothetical protein